MIILKYQKLKMSSPWSCLKLNYVPMTVGLISAIGLVTCYVVAVLNKDVSIYVPFISETGGKYPEAGLFSIVLYLTSTIALSTMFVRYLVVAELNKGIDRMTDILNRASIVIGFIALMGMVVVAAYPMTSVGTAHGIGANVLFLGGIIYAILQTFLSYKMSPTYNGLVICHIRSIISAAASFSLIAMLVLGPKAYDDWSSARHDHWTGSKVPYDKGFGLLLGSAIAEWSMVIFFVAYYLTFIREFGKVIIHLRVQLLVTHFDDEPPQDINRATERTPIVM